MITTFVLHLHISAGFLALVTGAIAMATKKGKGRHVTTGRIFFWSMVLVAITAIWLSVVRPNLFLLLIAIFSFYLSWSGYRAIRWKNDPIPGWAGVFDAIIVPVLFATGLAMILLPFLSGWNPLPVPDFLNEQGVLLLVFGFINISLGARDLHYQRNPDKREKFEWMYQHIAGMCGAYIATLTAFLVVNITFLPALLIWLGPTAIGSPLIAWWIRRYRDKFSAQKSNA